MEPLHAFEQFRTIHPLRQEEYNPTPENIRRWVWHIKERNNRPAIQPHHVDTSALNALRKERAVLYYRDFPRQTQAFYSLVASCFPGRQVFACGSRVRGDYFDETLDTRAARRSGGKPEKPSDFDFWVGDNQPEAHALPVGADRARCRIPETEKIPLPMWDFSKLPEHEHATIIRLLGSNDLWALAEIHNRYSLSERHICCDVLTAQRWFVWAVEQGIIKATDAYVENKQ